MKDRFLRKAEVAEMTGLSLPTIWRHEAAGTFPARRQLGPNSVAWLQSEVEAWMQSRPASQIESPKNEAHAA